MNKTRSTPAINISLGLTAGILVPMGLAPLGLWILSIAGLALLFARMQNSERWLGFGTASGFAFGYTISGQIWIYYSLFLLADIPPEAKLHSAGLLLIFPAILLTLILSLYSWLRVRLNIAPYSLASCFLFTALWLLFEVLYTLIPSCHPLLVIGYSILGLPYDALIPILGIFSSSLLIVIGSAFLCCILKHLFAGCYRPLCGLSITTALMFLAPVFLINVEWTWPYDLRPFEYVMQVHANADATDNFYPTLMENPPRLIILGGVRANINRPTFYRHLPDLEANPDTAFLAVFSQKDQNCPNIFCSFGEGEGCIREYLYKDPPDNAFGACNWHELPVSNPSSSRHPSVNAYRMMVLGSMADSLPFFAAENVTGSELLVVFDTPAKGQVIRERLLSADRARALETGRPVLRYSNTGLSAEIDHKGQVKARYLPEQDLITGRIQPMSGQTPYMRLGRYAPLAFTLLILLVFAYRRLFQTL